MSYFEEVVLPSVGLSLKASYSIPESLIILQCSRSHLYVLNHREQIRITPDKRVYRMEFERYFSERLPTPNTRKSRKKNTP